MTTLVKDVAKKFATTQFVVTTRRKSGYIKDGTGPEFGTPSEHLDCQKTLVLQDRSKLFLGKGLGYRNTQYVIGANTIYVDDYVLDKNDELVLTPMDKKKADELGYTYRYGLKSQGYDLNEEHRKTSEYRGGICFENGKLDLAKYGDDPMLLKFVQEHIQNVEAPRAKENTDSNRARLFMFEPLVKEQKITKAKPFENFDADLEAMTFVSKLRDKKANGTYEYDELRMDAILHILDAGIGFGPGETNQKFNMILTIQKRDGAAFMKLVTEVMNDYRATIGVGESLKTLKIDTKSVKILSGNEYRDLYTFKGEGSREEKVEELALYFLSSAEAQNYYGELIGLNDKKKIEALKK